MKPYDHKAIEKKWQNIWEESCAFHASEATDKPKFFALVEQPAKSVTKSNTHNKAAKSFFIAFIIFSPFTLRKSTSIFCVYSLIIHFLDKNYYCSFVWPL